MRNFIYFRKLSISVEIRREHSFREIRSIEKLNSFMAICHTAEIFSISIEYCQDYSSIVD